MNFRKKQNYGDIKRLVFARGWEWGGMNRQSTKEFYGSETTMYNTIIVDTYIIHLSKATECTTLRVNPKENYGLWVTMMSV